MKAPFPYFGAKSTVADIVWQRFGDVPNYTEAFAGSLAVLLSRPESHTGAIETVNDKDGLLSNFWRAVQHAPDEVAHYADWPVNENDLHARHGWLVGQKDALQSRLEGDPDYYDAKVAGWWVWGICAWIGSGWCSGNGPWHQVDGMLVNTKNDGNGAWRKLVHLGNAGRGINRQRVHLGNAGQGINRKRVHLGNAGQGINRKRVHLGNAGQGINRKRDDIGTCAGWSEHLRQIMQELSDRLRRVRVCSGDWSRICGPTPTFKNGLTGVFLDPPYEQTIRDATLYRVEDSVSAAVREWAIANGDNPLMRIALCGYDGEHTMPDSWETYHWKAKGGYASQGDGSNDNATKEVIWFSPHCLKGSKQGVLI